MIQSRAALLTLITTAATARNLRPRDYKYVPLPCAVTGYDTTKSYLWTGPNDTYPACSLECLSRPNCTGLSITDGLCNLYDVAMGDVYFWDGSSNTTFWDITCETEHYQCAAPGYQADWEDFWTADNMTMEACAAECLQAEEYCLSFSFGDGVCSLWEVPVTGTLDPSDESPYMFYDLGCLGAGTNGTSGMNMTLPLPLPTNMTLPANASLPTSAASSLTAAASTINPPSSASSIAAAVETDGTDDTDTDIDPEDSAATTSSSTSSRLARRYAHARLHALVERKDKSTTTTSTKTTTKRHTVTTTSSQPTSTTTRSNLLDKLTSDLPTVGLVVAIRTTSSTTTTTTATTTTRASSTMTTARGTTTSLGRVTTTTPITSKATSSGSKTTTKRQTIAWGSYRGNVIAGPSKSLGID